MLKTDNQVGSRLNKKERPLHKSVSLHVTQRHMKVLSDIFQERRLKEEGGPFHESVSLHVTHQHRKVSSDIFQEKKTLEAIQN